MGDWQERMEGKVDKLTEAVSKLAVVDERIAHIMETNSITAKRVENLEATLPRIAVVETSINDLKKVNYILATAFIGAVVGKLIGLL